MSDSNQSPIDAAELGDLTKQLRRDVDEALAEIARRIVLGAFEAVAAKEAAANEARPPEPYPQGPIG